MMRLSRVSLPLAAELIPVFVATPSYCMLFTNLDWCRFESRGSTGERENIVREGRDAERRGESCVVTRQGGVYPIPLSAGSLSKRQSRVISFVS